MDAQPDSDLEPGPVEMNNLLLRVMRGVNGQAFRLFGNRVHTGPFAGMKVVSRVPNWDDGNSGTKLLGCYEFELHDAVRYAVWRRPQVVVNVGCAEGYYAVGLARAMPWVTVNAFDIKVETLDLLRDMAKENDVADRIFPKVGCTDPSELTVANGGHMLYVIDCEGAELDLIDLKACPSLGRSDLIIECHDFLRPDISVSSMLADRLSGTHRVELIRPQIPDYAQFQFMRQFPTVMSVLMITEKRPMPCYWLACWANRKGNSYG